MNQYDKKTVEKNKAAQEAKKKALEGRKQQKQDAEMKNEEDDVQIITDPKEALGYVLAAK